MALSPVACGGNDGLSGKVATDGSTSMEKVIGGHCTNIAEWVEVSVTDNHRDCQ